MTSTAVTNFQTTTLSFTNRFHLQNEVSEAVNWFASLPLRRKNPRIDTIRGLCLVKRLGKPIFTPRHGVWQIDSICQT